MKNNLRRIWANFCSEFSCIIESGNTLNEPNERNFHMRKEKWKCSLHLSDFARLRKMLQVCTLCFRFTPRLVDRMSTNLGSPWEFCILHLISLHFQSSYSKVYLNSSRLSFFFQRLLFHFLVESSRVDIIRKFIIIGTVGAVRLYSYNCSWRLGAYEFSSACFLFMVWDFYLRFEEFQEINIVGIKIKKTLVYLDSVLSRHENISFTFLPVYVKPSTTRSSSSRCTYIGSMAPVLM